jgi:hypothetical protein
MARKIYNSVFRPSPSAGMIRIRFPGAGLWKDRFRQGLRAAPYPLIRALSVSQPLVRAPLGVFTI